MLIESKKLFKECLEMYRRMHGQDTSHSHHAVGGDIALYS